MKVQEMASSSSYSVVNQLLGSFAFAIFWVLAVFPGVAFLPIGRTAGSLLSSMLMVVFQVITPEEAYASIDLSILGLLFGTMIISVYLERADAFKYLGKFLTWKSQGGRDLVIRLCFVSATASAFFTNDTTCMVLTEFALKIARQHNLPPQPFLLALASSANIGSSATPIGNPQNLVIALDGKISFGDFIVGILPAAFVGVLVNAVLILFMFWRDLSADSHPHLDGDGDGDYEEIIVDREIDFRRFSQATLSTFGCSNYQDRGSILSLESGGAVALDSTQSSKWKRILWKSCVYTVTTGMLIALVMGMNMAWTVITAALALVVLDFKDAEPCLDKVSYSLLVFFCGMFMTIEGFENTGIPSSLWLSLEPYAQLRNATGLALLAILIVILSNVISNVPTVLLLGGRMAISAAAISPSYVKRAWLILAWVSTVGGNLSVVGSAANMIVCEQARRSPHVGYYLSFWSHLKFGVPSTILVTAIGLFIISLLV